VRLKSIKQTFKIEYPVRKTKDQVIDDLTGQIIHRAAHRISLSAELFEETIRSYDGSMELKYLKKISLGCFSEKIKRELMY